MMADKQTPNFVVQRVYVKDLSFESPNAPEVFRGEWKPEVSVDLSDESRSLGEGVHEVVLKINVTAKIGDKNAFVVEVQQAAVFTMEHFSEEQQKHLLGSMCLNIIYPYARESISDLVVRGGFPQLLLAPVNFEALYQQRSKDKTEA